MPFEPGKSGNPGGRPVGIRRYVQRKCGKQGKKVIDAIYKLAFGEERIPAKVRLDALTALADRGWGKPPQSLELEGDGQVFGALVFGGRYRETGELVSGSAQSAPDGASGANALNPQQSARMLPTCAQVSAHESTNAPENAPKAPAPSGPPVCPSCGETTDVVSVDGDHVWSCTGCNYAFKHTPN